MRRPMACATALPTAGATVVSVISAMPFLRTRGPVADAVAGGRHKRDVQAAEREVGRPRHAIAIEIPVRRGAAAPWEAPRTGRSHALGESPSICPPRRCGWRPRGIEERDRLQNLYVPVTRETSTAMTWAPRG